MKRNDARFGRRRRVLQEEIRVATESAMAIPAQAQELFEPGDTPRYGVRANIENHPQVTDFVPRRYRVIGAFVVVPMVVGALLEWGRSRTDQLAEFVQLPSLAARLDTTFAGLLNWTAAVVMVLAAVAATVVYSLRRYRVDDYRGRYRAWRFAALVGIAASANAVAGVHVLVAEAGATLLGKSYLPGGAGWWLVPVTLVAGWVLLRIAFDAAECRSSFAAFSLAGLLFSSAAVFSIGLVPSPLLVDATSAAPMLLLGGYVMTMAGCLFYARYVVLDVQGLIEHRGSTPASTNSTEARDVQRQPKQTESAGAGVSKQDEPLAWVDGSEPEEQEPRERSRKLSKAEKRRLRKRQSNQRAA